MGRSKAKSLHSERYNEALVAAHVWCVPAFHPPFSLTVAVVDRGEILVQARESGRILLTDAEIADLIGTLTAAADAPTPPDADPEHCDGMSIDLQIRVLGGDVWRAVSEAGASPAGVVWETSRYLFDLAWTSCSVRELRLALAGMAPYFDLPPVLVVGGVVEVPREANVHDLCRWLERNVPQDMAAVVDLLDWTAEEPVVRSDDAEVIARVLLKWPHLRWFVGPERWRSFTGAGADPSRLEGSRGVR